METCFNYYDNEKYSYGLAVWTKYARSCNSASKLECTKYMHGCMNDRYITLSQTNLCHRKTRSLPQCKTDDVYSPMTDLSQSILGSLSFVVAKKV